MGSCMKTLIMMIFSFYVVGSLIWFCCRVSVVHMTIGKSLCKVNWLKKIRNGDNDIGRWWFDLIPLFIIELILNPIDWYGPLMVAVSMCYSCYEHDLVDIIMWNNLIMYKMLCLIWICKFKDDMIYVWSCIMWSY